MTDKKQTQTLWQLMKVNFPLKQFVIGALVPIAFFYIFHRIDKPLIGAFCASGWGIGVALVTRFLLKNTNLFAVLAIPFSLIKLIGIVITLSPDFYLVWPAIEKFIWGLIYFGSVLISRPLILILAQATGMFPKSKDLDDFGDTYEFRSAWVILTVIWGVVQLVAAVLLILSLYRLPLEVFLIIRTASGAPLMAVLLTFSFWFPGWYWKRSSTISQ